MPMPRRDVRPEEERVGRRRTTASTTRLARRWCGPAPMRLPTIQVAMSAALMASLFVDHPRGLVSSSPAQKVWRRLWAATRRMWRQWWTTLPDDQAVCWPSPYGCFGQLPVGFCQPVRRGDGDGSGG
jgi:hypothetical protein